MAIRRAGNEGKLRKERTYFFLSQVHRARLREIGEHFGLSEAAVSQSSRRLRVTGEKDAVVKKQLEQIRNKLEL